VNYVALDVKTSLDKYKRLGAKEDGELLRTVGILKTGNVEYEFRTTVVPGLVEMEDVRKICEVVKGAKIYAFQQFVPGDVLDKQFDTLVPYSPKIMSSYADVMKEYVSEVILRI
jgi:pyruvate formate lyase activating enzyme